MYLWFFNCLTALKIVFNLILSTGEQVVCCYIVIDIVLDTGHYHGVHVPGHFQRGYQTRKAAFLQVRKSTATAQRVQRRHAGLGRWLVQDAARSGGSQHTDQRPKYYKNEAGAQGCQDIGYHHGHVHLVLAAIFLMVNINFVNFTEQCRLSWLL